MGRTERSFAKMESILTDSGYVVINNSYPSTKHPIDELATLAIPAALEECPDSSIVHVVTHSLGGILIRAYLDSTSIESLGRVVMLAPPNHGSEVTDQLKNNSLYRWVNGPAGQQLGTDSTSLPNQLGGANFELGIIAGTKTVNPILSTMLPNPDDGKVSVESTKLEGMADHLELPASHTFIMRDDEAIRQTLYFLKTGNFDHSH